MTNQQAQNICDIVWGNSHLTISDKLSNWFWGPSPSNLPRFEASKTISRLSKHNLTDEQIYQVRDACTQASYIAWNYVIQKYNIEEKYQSINQDAFGVYQLFLNVGYDALFEYGTKAQQLFILRLEKLNLGYIGKVH
jgi:hypothetical protein